MLKIFRKKIVSKIILWSLLILILPAFVMWGSASISRSKEKGPKYVGTIDNRKISFEEFYNALSGIRSQIILNYFNQPKVLDALLGNKSLLAKLAWDRLLLMREAKKLKIRVSNKEVVQFLQTHPLFSRNGVFDEKFYAYILRNNIGLEPRVFEETVREDIAASKLTSMITKDIKVSDEEAAAEYGKEFQKIKISYALIEPKDFADKIDKQAPDDKVLRDFYEKNKAAFVFHPKEGVKAPERLATFEEAKDTIRKFMLESEMRKLASQHADDMHKKIGERMEKESEAFAKAALRFGLKTSDTQAFSQSDPLEGIGDAPLITDAASLLKDGGISKPVEINKGFIIFSVLERQPADQEKFKKEKDEYSKKALEGKKSKFLEEWLRKLESKATLLIKFEELDQYYK